MARVCSTGFGIDPVSNGAAGMRLNVLQFNTGVHDVVQDCGSQETKTPNLI